MGITPDQCRAARALLGMSQEDLATKAKVSRTTLVFFERGERDPVTETLEAIEKVLHQAGAVFVDKTGYVGIAPSKKKK